MGAVAERNAESILEAAIHVLAERPDAGMAEIAAAAGVGRATVYRHFPHRDALLDALRRRAWQELHAAVAAAVDAGRQGPRAGLERFVAGMVALGDRYAILAPREPRKVERKLEDALRPLHGLIEEAQRTGAIDPSLSPRFVVGALRGLIAPAREEVRSRRLARDDVPALVVGTLLDGAASPAP